VERFFWGVGDGQSHQKPAFQEKLSELPAARLAARSRRKRDKFRGVRFHRGQNERFGRRRKPDEPGGRHLACGPTESEGVQTARQAGAQGFQIGLFERPEAIEGQEELIGGEIFQQGGFRRVEKSTGKREALRRPEAIFHIHSDGTSGSYRTKDHAFCMGEVEL